MRRVESRTKVSRRVRILATAVLALSLALPACGFEVLLIGQTTGKDHEPPKQAPATVLVGKAPDLPGGTVTATAAGKKVAEATAAADGSFELNLPLGTDFANLSVVAAAGAAVLKSVVPEVKAGTKVDAGALDTASTTRALILEARLSAEGLELINYPSAGADLALKKLAELLATSTAPHSKVLEQVQALHKAALAAKDGSPVFRQPRYKKAEQPADPPVPVQGALNPEFCSQVGSGSEPCRADSGGRVTFDTTLAAAAAALTLPKCTFDPKTIRVVLTANVSLGTKDSNCSEIKKWKWANRYGGPPRCKLFIALGVHKDSGVQDPKVAAYLGSWEPNRVPMYDDGTHGDLVAGDGVWTKVLELPRGTADKPMRIGYKFTCGSNGDIWGGTEEWPGNQRILEISDVNGDGFVARHDNFGDETSNKDSYNLLKKRGATGMVCFAEPPKASCSTGDPAKDDANCGCKVDHDGDGQPDARERQWDQDQDCKADGWKVYGNVQPIVAGCSY